MIVVIGAGLIGLGIAYELARRGAPVRVIDEGEPGRAASWAAAGMLAPFTEELESAEYAAFCADSLARFPAFVASLEADGGVDARLRLDGILEVAYDERSALQLRAQLAVLASHGVAIRWLERDEVRELEPGLGTAVRGASLSEAEGHVDNRRLVSALQAACAALGVRVDAGAGRVALETDGRRVVGVRGPDGLIGADAVVNATGAWASELEGVPPGARVPVRPIKGQMLALSMPEGFVRHVLWVPGAYLVPREDGRLLIGATAEDVGFDVRVTASGLRTLLSAALEALPGIGEFALAETWAGLRPGSPDGLPFIGTTSLSGYLVATGHYRNGVLLAPGTAVAIADVLEGRPAAGLEVFSPQRAQEARPAPANQSA